ncbi:MAG TPA: hypothetical protein VK988_09965 [Acidimicrobiales bacterium]|nr:hypothetical protein [Acidimicrobiales bacterium]
MSEVTDANDFYEDDEPVEQIQSAFEGGDKGVTKRPWDVNPLAEAATGTAVAEQPVKKVLVGPVSLRHPNAWPGRSLSHSRDSSRT